MTGQPTIQPTTWTNVATAALCGAGFSWLYLTSCSSFGWDMPVVPWTAVVMYSIVAVSVVVLAITTHQRIQVRRERTDPRRAVTLLVGGKTALLGGAALGAGYAVVVIKAIGLLPASAPMNRVLFGGMATLVCLVLAVGGYFLERACQIPVSPDGNSQSTSGESVES